MRHLPVHITRAFRRDMTTLVGLLLALCWVLASGCAAPLAHPMRVEGDGPILEVSTGGMITSGRQGGCDNDQGCVDGDGARFFGIPPLILSGGYGAMVAEHVGLMGGLYLPAWVNQKKNFYASPGALYGHLTLQNDHLSIGLGPELGTGGVAGTVTLEARDGWGWTSKERPLRIGAWVRRFQPFKPTPTREFNPRAGSWDGGVRLTFFDVFVQYGYYRQDHGVMNFVIYETSTYTAGFHSVLVGVAIDGLAFKKRRLR